MIDSVFDFGSLSADTERVYINAIIRRQLRIYVNDQEERAQLDELKRNA